jgi:tetratricopeptide (TPR) repeat protein
VALAAAIISYLAEGFIDVQTLGAKPAVLIWIFLGIGAAPVVLPLLERKTPLARKIPWLRVITPLAFICAIAAGILIFNPAAVYSNRGSLLAHQFLYQPNQASSLSVEKAQAARQDLVRAVALAPDESHLHQVLGRLDGWLGNDQTALDELSRAVELDGKNPYSVYFPPKFIIQRLKPMKDPEANWNDLLDVYAHWVERFPQRADGYLLCSILTAQQKHDLKSAETYLTRGLDQQAVPRQLLQYYLARLKNSAPD